jgi:hypothetical protein
MPRAADTLEKSPTKLQRMVRAYLPPSWYLVAVGIATNVVDIVQDGFQGSQVIVVDWFPDCTCFLHNTLQSVYTTNMHMLRPIPVDRSTGPSTGEGTGSAEHPSDHVHEHSFEEEIHDQTTREAERNEVEESEEGTEDDNTGSQGMRARIPRMRTRRRRKRNWRRRTHRRMMKHRRRMMTVTVRNQGG